MTAREKLLLYLEALPLTPDQRRELVLRIADYSCSMAASVAETLQPACSG